ncbi:MAG: DUF4838 domain-containing protein [Kiritimatiellae bacterium]|nr:DUF4838 domain-containing protein [Kiritimatiellia bacterium]
MSISLKRSLAGHLAIVGILSSLVFCRCEAAAVNAGWKIVLPEKEDSGVYAAIRAAAMDLSGAFKEGAGWDVQIVESTAAPVRGAVFLGRNAAEKAGLSCEGLVGFDNVIAEKGGNVYIFGRDRPGRNRRNLDSHHCVLPTVKGVTRFMETYMNVRFLAPGGLGRDVARFDRVSVPDGASSRERVVFDYSAGRKDTMMYDCANNIVGLGSYHTYGGATYDPACPPEKYFRDHPEYFGLIHGVRTVTPRACVPLCPSNPAVEDLIVQELLRRYDEGADVVELGQQDGWRACECENCAAFFEKEAGRDDWCEKLWCFHRKIAERIEKLRPGKIVLFLAYGPTLEHLPRSFRKFPSNAMVELCRYSEETFEAWKGYEVPHGFTVYIYLWGPWPKAGYTPKLSYGQASKYARLFAENRVRGMYRCGYGELYGTEGPAYYVFNRTLSNPEAIPETLVDEYCRRMYGPAARAMRTFHDILDKRLQLDDGARNAMKPLEALAYVYGGDTIKRMEDWLSYAETLAKEPKYRSRLKIVRAEFDYAKNIGRIASLYLAWKVVPTEDLRGQIGRLLLERKDILAGLLGGGKSVPPHPEWPELRFMGGETADNLLHNGRLGAVINAPLVWDPTLLPTAHPVIERKRKSTYAAFTVREPSFSDFGNLPADAWQTLGGVQLGAVRTRTRFACMFGAEAFYLAVETDLGDDVRVRPFERDGTVWRDESLELVLDASGTRTRFLHFVWSPESGACFDEAYGYITDPVNPLYGKCDAGWDGDWTVRNGRRNNVWRSILRMPYSTLGVGRPKSGDKWSMNLARTAFAVSPGRPSGEQSLWNPDMESGAFCSKDAMGELKFR